jgi:hypothetical protein
MIADQMAGLIVIALATLFGVLLISRALRSLRVKHPQTYEALGSPPPPGNLAFFRFLLMREYDALDDFPLSNLLRFLRGYLGIYIFSLALVLLLVLSPENSAY